ncbi:hypothetical protein D910_03961 [Dendroctonus ponderosae]|uniref:HAT C-terminal dimerisation domain-containing protein n=1 Tax=Dendroctonus ponderosae TaxID=77166 RepID=U4TY58_DENPD|nr:hypothetical protein D910_03961 [Dendroctonus ponderosae]
MQEILVTAPMTTGETERCFSTLKPIKTFLRNSMTEDRLSALSMISIENTFISEIDKFNEMVIDKFATRKDRRIELELLLQNTRYISPRAATVPAYI